MLANIVGIMKETGQTSVRMNFSVTAGPSPKEAYRS